MNERVRSLAQQLWDYHRLGHELVKSDAIVVLCSHDERVAERGAELFLDKWAPLLIFSGGLGAIKKGLWTEPEAIRFSRIAESMGVPSERILIEDRSTNTGENVRNTRELLVGRGLDPKNFIAVQKPYMERRTFATFKKVWPEKTLIVTSPQVSLDQYLDQYAHSALTPEDVVAIMVGDLQRIKIYPDKGFQIPQEIPPAVWSAYEELVHAGFDKYLVK
ncbi:MAG TPA: YdcF family protein [Pyrinomonadaceae bacterium]|nr:YdcF family protein [Pyrinomonadaceae bacterium]